MPKINQLLTINGLLLAAFLVASPSLAQSTGTIRGTVLGQGDQPLAEVKVTIESLEPPIVRIEDETNDDGKFTQIGLRPTDYVITVEKDGQRERKTLRLLASDPFNWVFNLDIASAIAPVTFLEVLAQVDRDRQDELRELFAQGVAASNASNYDEAVTNFNAALAIAANCYDCYYYLGQAYIGSSQDADAQGAFQQAASVMPENSAPYRALVNVYNRQLKWDEAGKAALEAARLSGDLSTDPDELYDQGVTFWNTQKTTEAKVQFEQTISRDPDHADAHYHLALTNLSQGNAPAAVSALERYLELDRNGQYADPVRAMLEQLKP